MLLIAIDWLGTIVSMYKNLKSLESDKPDKKIEHKT